MSDREWILDGANVYVSMVGFDSGEETVRALDARTIAVINANVTATADITQAKRLRENAAMSLMGDTKGGPFDISAERAIEFLAIPNPHGRPNSDVVPWTNGIDVTRRSRGIWIIDVPCDVVLHDAAAYEAPFPIH